jgi:hypothetical protein
MPSAKALADLADEMDARAANAEQAHASDAALRRE